MTLIKTSLLNAIAVAIKMLTMLGLNKILAIYVGPAGYAAIGNFQNAVQVITAFASGAINTGVVKYTAEYYENEEMQRQVWRTAGSIALFGSVITGIVVTVFSKQIAQWFLGDKSYSSVFIWFSIALVFFVFNTLLLAILNGKKEIHRYVIANIAGSLFSLAVTGFLAVFYGLYGALTALAIHPSFSFVITFFLCRKAAWFKFSYFFGRLDKEVVKNLTKYTLMAVFSAILAPVSHMLIRQNIGNTLGWDAAGYWEAMWRLSAAYLMFVTTVLSVYYLPKMSELVSAKEIKRELIGGVKIIAPVTVACSLFVYLLRDFITITLFSSEFIEMVVMYKWQMVGDSLKIISYLLSFLMLAKAMVKLMILSQVFFHSLFFLLVVLFTRLYGIEGASIAHAINYSVYLVFCYFFIYRRLSKIA